MPLQIRSSIFPPMVDKFKRQYQKHLKSQETHCPKYVFPAKWRMLNGPPIACIDRSSLCCERNKTRNWQGINILSLAG